MVRTLGADVEVRGYGGCDYAISRVVRARSFVGFSFFFLLSPPRARARGGF